jgi:hypothetical protein
MLNQEALAAAGVNSERPERLGNKKFRYLFLAHFISYLPIQH